MQVNLRKWFCISTALLFLPTCFISSAYADGFLMTKEPTGSSWFMGVGGGTSKINLDSTTTVNNGVPAPAPFNSDIFSINNPRADNLQFTVGYQWQELKKFLPAYSLFLQYRHYLSTNIKGQVEQFSIPEFTNYNYQMSYEADLFTLNGKLDLVQWQHLMPYVSAGVGAVINHVNNYSETAIAPVTPRDSPAYNGNSRTNLAGTLGAGFDFVMTENTWLTLGYEHVFQGDVRSGPGATTWSSTLLDFGNANMDTVFLSISANFPQAFRR